MCIFQKQVSFGGHAQLNPGTILVYIKNDLERSLFLSISWRQLCMLLSIYVFSRRISKFVDFILKVVYSSHDGHIMSDQPFPFRF